MTFAQRLMALFAAAAAVALVILPVAVHAARMIS
jgi:hypothetical protein